MTYSPHNMRILIACAENIAHNIRRIRGDYECPTYGNKMNGPI